MNQHPSIRNKKICVSKSENLTVIPAGGSRGVPGHPEKPNRAMSTASSKRMFADLAEGVAHVWIVSLDATAGTLEHMAACLSGEERQRRARMTSETERRRFVVSRGALRTILALCCGRDVMALSLLRAPRGKPHLDGPGAFEFSLSHSRDIAVIAVAAVPVGVDVEHLRESGRYTRAAARVLHHDTNRVLAALPPDARDQAFVDAWTLREAHVKAVGGGLFRTPDSIPFEPGMPRDGRIVRVAERDGDAQWSVARFVPAPGTSAALTARGELHGLVIHDATETFALLTGGD
jgi:4'-phosphopantetheinyl transferase